MVISSPWPPRQPSSEGAKATDQTSTAPAPRAPCAAREVVRQPFFESGRRLTGCSGSFLNVLVKYRKKHVNYVKSVLSCLNNIAISVQHTPCMFKSSKSTVRRNV